MGGMILATILFCSVAEPGVCPVRYQVRVERRICNLAPIRAQLPHDGRWHDSTIRIVCGG